MSLSRSFFSRRSSSIRCFSLSKSLKEFRTVNPAAVAGFGQEGESENAIDDTGSDRWANLLPEILADIVGRVEASEEKWPNRRNVVACGCVCQKWRDVVREIVKSPRATGIITFPSCLKQPGPGDLPLQCLIKRDKKNSTFYLYLSISPSSFSEKGKFLLAARRCRHGPHTEYIISLDADDISQGSHAYLGKLRSDFLGTNFMIYDSEPPYKGAKPSSSHSTRRFASKRISPQVPAGNFDVGKVSYKFNLLKSRGPRRMVCSINHLNTDPEQATNTGMNKSDSSSSEYTILRNKAPRWHENLQCWCLNFHGRVTVASVKNFQLIASADPSHPGTDGDDDVLLQFGKVADDTFTMDYRQPLSAFHAFAICVTSFGTKLAYCKWFKRANHCEKQQFKLST
ncbi:hypothetical protein V2J09_009122 [Rumex salicifolius]